MQEVLNYFDTIPTHVRSIILVSGILFFLINSSTKNMIPKGKYIAVIGICIGLLIVVVYLVKVRCHKYV